MYKSIGSILLVCLEAFAAVKSNIPTLRHGKIKKPSCSWPSDWIVQKELTCYGRDSRPTPVGSFQIKGNRTLVAIRLVHLSGGLTCPYSINPSKWGCRRNPCNSDCFTTLIKMSKSITPINMETRDYRNLYSYPGYTIEDDVLVIKSSDWPVKVKDGEQFSLMSYGGSESGFHCVRVEASFLL